MPERRKALDLKTIMVIIAALTGGSLSGVGVKFINSNEYDAKVFQNEKKVEAVIQEFHNYKKSHAEKMGLKDKLLTTKLDQISDDIKELKEEMIKIRNGY